MNLSTQLDMQVSVRESSLSLGLSTHWSQHRSVNLWTWPWNCARWVSIWMKPCSSGSAPSADGSLESKDISGQKVEIVEESLTDSEEDVVGGPGTCCWGCDFLYPVGAGFGCRKLPPGEKRVTYFIMIMAGWKWFCRTHFILSSRTPELFTKHCGLLKIRS